MADDLNQRNTGNTSHQWSKPHNPTEDGKGLRLYNDKITDQQKNTTKLANIDRCPTKMRGPHLIAMDAHAKFSSQLDHNYTSTDVAGREKAELSVSPRARDILRHWGHASAIKGGLSEISDSVKPIEVLESSANFASNEGLLDPNQSLDTASLTKNEQCGNKVPCKYKTKVLSLVFFRASVDKSIGRLLLGTDIHNIGEFNDICIRYKEGNERANIFLHTIHKYDTHKHRITFDELWTEDGDFSLFKYFNSYLKIRLKFNVSNPDVMFDEQYENEITYFILYTTVKDDLDERKCVDDDKIKMRQTMKKLFSTNKEKLNIFQYKYDERDIDLLTKIILKDRLKSIAQKLLQFTGDCRCDLDDDVIKMYHLVLAEQVVRRKYYGTQFSKFRKGFLCSNDEVLIMLRDAIYEETVKIKSPNVDSNECIRMILFNPNADTISELIGNVIIYNNQSKRLEIVENEVECVEPKLREALAELQVSRTVVRKAMNAAGFNKLNKTLIRLPKDFGKPNFNIGFNPKRLQFLTEYIEMVIKKSKDNIILIDSDKPGNGVAEWIIQDIGKAVRGHLWILDKASNSLKFNIMNKHTIKYIELKQLLRTLESRIEDLGSYRFVINLPGVPKLTLGVDPLDKGLARDFLNSLWFFTGQAKETEIDEIAKKEIIEQASWPAK